VEGSVKGQDFEIEIGETMHCKEDFGWQKEEKQLLKIYSKLFGMGSNG
jgi:hypothetical protein